MNDILKAAESLTAGDLELLISKLAELRASREPAVEIDPPLGKHVGAIPAPRFWTEPEAMTGGCLLGLRHTGIGWLWFLLTKDDRRALMNYWTNQDQELPRSSPSKMN